MDIRIINDAKVIKVLLCNRKPVIVSEAVSLSFEVGIISLKYMKHTLLTGADGEGINLVGSEGPYVEQRRSKAVVNKTMIEWTMFRLIHEIQDMIKTFGKGGRWGIMGDVGERG